MEQKQGQGGIREGGEGLLGEEPTGHPLSLERLLDHLKLPSTPPPLAPARSPLDEQDLFAEEEPSDPAYQEEIDPCDGDSSARAPP